MKKMKFKDLKLKSDFAVKTEVGEAFSGKRETLCVWVKESEERASSDIWSRGFKTEDQKNTEVVLISL